MKKKVVFVNPPLGLEQRYGALSDAGGVEIPLGLVYLAAVVRENGFDAGIVDSQALGLNDRQTVQAVMAHHPDYVCLTATTPTINKAAMLGRNIKQDGFKIVNIIGGCHLSALPKQTMQDHPCFDFGVIGEAEQTLPELLGAIEKKEELEHVDGLAYRQNGDIRVTKPRARIRELDVLPMPAFDLLPELRKHYYLPIQNVNKLPSVSLITSRGCAGRCIFCDKSVFGNQFSFHSAEYMVRMLNILKEEYGIKSVMFQDDNFLALKSRLREFCALLKQANLNISWSAQARVDSIESETLKLIKESGCWQLSFGIESASQDILDFYQKNIKVERIKQTISLTKKAGILTKGFFIFGGPLETEQSLKESVEFLLSSDLDDISVTFFTPYPGAAIWETVESYGNFDRDLNKLNCFQIVFSPWGLSKETIMFYQKKAIRRFYLRWRIIASYLKRITSFAYFRRLLGSSIAVLRHVFRRESSAALIVSADDFGLTKEVNQGVVKAYGEGIATSASLMPNGEAFEDAVSLIRQCQGLDVGLHLTLVEEKPVLSSDLVPSLLNGTGTFHKDYRNFIKAYLLGRIDIHQVERELDAQFRKVIQAGIKISHVDSHQHLHLLPGIMKVVVRLAKKYQVSKIRLPYMPLTSLLSSTRKRQRNLVGKILSNILSLGYRQVLNREQFIFPTYYYNFSGLDMTPEDVIKFLARINKGVWEFVFHPAVHGMDSAQRYTHWGYDWPGDLDILIHQRLKDEAKHLNIKLINYQSL
ncbi:MAG: ChbG/HpnK family deacetylase [Candidatus Omnitrophica bacterium]|nr:ChbG/HpnK family deacetylase [Candidatus Omnitrophota bacterium]